jgi:hypothetical protein
MWSGARVFHRLLDPVPGELTFPSGAGHGLSGYYLRQALSEYGDIDVSARNAFLARVAERAGSFVGTYRFVVTIDHSALGGRGTNTWHGRTEDSVGTAGLDDVSAAVKAFYEDVSGIFPTGTVIKTDGQMVGVGSTEGEYAQAAAWTATLTGSGVPLPPSQCICVNWRGQSGDRSRRGRTFLGPLNTDTLESDGTPTGDTLTACRDAAAALIAESQSLDQTALGIYSRQEDLFRDFVASSVANQFAVLRSRRD